MIGFLTRTFAILALVSSSALAAVDDGLGPSDIYTKGYMEYLNGDKSLQAGNLREGFNKLQTSRDWFDRVAREHPNWNPEMVDYRRKIVYRMLEETRKKIGPDAPGPGPKPDIRPIEDVGELTRRLRAELDVKTRTIANLHDQLDLKNQKIENLEREVVQHKSQSGLGTEAAKRLAMAKQEAEQLAAEVDIKNRQIASLTNQLKSAGTNAEERKKLEAELAAAKNSQIEADTARKGAEKNVEAMSQELAIAKAAAAAADKNLKEAEDQINKLKMEVQQEKELTQRHELEKQEKEKEIQGLQREINLLRALAEDPEKAPTDTAVEDLYAQLDQKKKDLREAKEEVMRLRDENAKLRRENASLKLKNEDLLAQLQKKDEELELKGQEIEALRKDLAAANKEIARLEKENQDYKIQVAKLRAELEEIAGKLTKAQQAAANAPDSVVAELKLENKLMKDQVVRMIRGQERRKLARELLIKELKRYAIDSRELLDAVDVVFHETGIINEAYNRIDSDLENNPAGGAALPVKHTNPGRSGLVLPESTGSNPGGSSTGSASATPEAATEMDQLLVDANVACSEGRYAEAEKAYQDYLRSNPNDPMVLANLGLAKMNLKKYKEATIVLNNSLTSRPGDPYAKFLLGVNAFHQGNLDDARDALTGTVLAEPDNEKAYHYLGVIALKQGQRDAAKEHFLNAVKFDAKYATAHYNLAVLYATSADTPDLEKARYHYTNAIDSGAQPDQGMEKLLNGN